MSELSDRINALPNDIRDYVHDLETRCDPAGDVAVLTLIREQNVGLQTVVERLTKALNDVAHGMCGNSVSLEQSPEAFRSAMWVWSQKTAKEAIRETEPQYVKDERHEKLMTGNWENS